MLATVVVMKSSSAGVVDSRATTPFVLFLVATAPLPESLTIPLFHASLLHRLPTALEYLVAGTKDEHALETLHHKP